MLTFTVKRRGDVEVDDSHEEYHLKSQLLNYEYHLGNEEKFHFCHVLCSFLPCILEIYK